MTLGPRLDLRQSQTLIMTPQLRQAIKLLQFSNLEVSAFVDEELERNPLLERDERGEAELERPALDQTPLVLSAAQQDVTSLVADTTMSDRYSSPLDTGEPFDAGSAADGAPFCAGRPGSHDFDHERGGIEDLIGAHLIAMLDPSGRLGGSPADLATALGASLDCVEVVRSRMQRFDPVGMFCVDLRECLAVQLADRNRLDPAMAMLVDNLELLARREMKRLMQLCEVDAEDLADMVAELRALDPKPGALFDAAPLQPLVPDVLMRRAPITDGDSAWLLELNPETMPRLLVNQAFHARVSPAAAREDRAFLAEKLQSANWLVKSLQQRAQTILKVSSEIVRQQDAFFRHGVAHLRPLILRDIAEAVGLHESTVSRVTSNKYIATPRGTFELKFFFTAAIGGTSGESHSAEAVRHRIRALVCAEAATKVLSDDAIVCVLRREGVDIARRTVAKYREALHIPSSVQRRRDKVVLA
jgi:RNA polymerase sigma-54 factor